MSNKNKDGKSLLDFILGIAALAAGLFLLGLSVTVSTSWYVYRIGAFSLPTGIVIIPLLIGIGMLFYNHKSKAAWVVSALGLLLIIITILLSVHIYVRNISLLHFIFMLGFILAGIGLLLKFWFKD